jgi:diguanylate cyclase (GGDEF)-like protein/PAS domain S-box-containing protein
MPPMVYMTGNAQPAGGPADAAPTPARRPAVTAEIAPTDDDEPSAGRYRAMAEATSDAHIGADNAGRITSWNEAATRTFGHTDAQALGAPLTMLMPERYQARHSNGLARLANGGSPRLLGRTIEMVGLHARGHEFPIEMSLASWDDDGHVGFMAVIRDITRRRRAEDHLAHYATIVGATSDAIIALDLDGVVTTWNQGARSLYGYGEREAIGRPLADLIVPPSRFAEKAEALALVAAGEPVERETTRHRRDGTEVDVHVVLSPIKDLAGRTLGIVTIHRDITGRKLAERSLAQATKRFRVCFDDAPIGMMLTSLRPGSAGRVLETNDALSRMLGHTKQQLASLHLDDICAVEDLELLQENVQALHAGGGADYRTELRLRHRDGRAVWVALSFQALTDDHGIPEYAISQASDVSDRRAAEEQLAFQALHDPLTGVANRRLLEDRLAQALARGNRDGRSLALLYLDLDKFKQVNDSLGHALGDMVLQTVTKRIAPVLRDTDTLARLGGDEFVILLEGLSNPGEEEAVAARIHAALHAPIDSPTGPIDITASIGVAVLQEGDDARTLLHNADSAMYRAKASGRGRSELFDKALASHAVDHLRIERELRAACAEDRLVLYYQPIVEVSTGRVDSVEALLRYRTRGGRLVLPDEFIAHAERAGMLESIGQWIVPEAFQQLAEWRAAGHPDLGVAVNVSTRQLGGDHLLRSVTEALDHHDLPADAVTLEVTESVVVDAVESAVGNLGRLKERGVHLAMDDFGTGYSSLTNLRRIDIDVVKIDRLFVANMQDEAESASIVTAILGLAKALDLDVVAEGVETAAQASALRQLGCEHLQGYFFGRAAAAAEVDLTDRAWLRQHLPHPRPADSTSAGAIRL